MWTKEEFQEHIKMNTTKEAGVYSAAVVIAGLYLKIYGELPKIGLSGQQAEFAQEVCDKLPCTKESCCRG